MIKLKVNGSEFAGFQTGRITRGIETVAGSFELSVSDRWNGQEKPWPILEGDECEVSVDGTTVITGFVDRRSSSYSATEHSLTVSGRDKTGDLVDCSALLDKWEFRNLSVQTFATRVCAPFGIDVVLQGSLGSAPVRSISKLSIDPGESAFEAIEKACRATGLLAVSDGAGRLLLTRAGTGRCKTVLVERKNILAATADFDVSTRFNVYLVMGQHHGTDEFSGASAASIKASAEDANIRGARTLIVRAEGSLNGEQAKTRAQWEAKVRAGRGDGVTVTVQGWTQADGTLWPVNKLVGIEAPFLGINGQLLITQATYTIGDDGTLTQLTLRRPDAYTPEPVVTTKSTGLWKEIERGV